MTLKKVNMFIREAWIAGILSALATLYVSVAGVNGANLWCLIDVVFISGMTFGIYKKSRVCAIIMVIYFFINRLLRVDLLLKSPSMLIMTILFGWAFISGIIGTFVYHKMAKAEGNSGH